MKLSIKLQFLSSMSVLFWIGYPWLCNLQYLTLVLLSFSNKDGMNPEFGIAIYPVATPKTSLCQRIACIVDCIMDSEFETLRLSLPRTLKSFTRGWAFETAESRISSEQPCLSNPFTRHLRLRAAATLGFIPLVRYHFYHLFTNFFPYPLSVTAPTRMIWMIALNLIM